VGIFRAIEMQRGTPLPIITGKPVMIDLPRKGEEKVAMPLGLPAHHIQQRVALFVLHDSERAL
jgi:hypothetical protein